MRLVTEKYTIPSSVDDTNNMCITPSMKEAGETLNTTECCMMTRSIAKPPRIPAQYCSQEFPTDKRQCCPRWQDTQIRDGIKEIFNRKCVDTYVSSDHWRHWFCIPCIKDSGSYVLYEEFSDYADGGYEVKLTAFVCEEFAAKLYESTLNSRTKAFDECWMNIWDANPDWGNETPGAEEGSALGSDVAPWINPRMPSYWYENAEQFLNAEQIKPPFLNSDIGHDLTVMIVPKDEEKILFEQTGRYCYNGVIVPEGATSLVQAGIFAIVSSTLATLIM